MKKAFKKLYRTLRFDIWPLKKVFLFESKPDFSDSAKTVFEEMIRRGFNKKIKFYWIVDTMPKNIPIIKNVFFIKSNNKKVKNLVYTATAMFWCNSPLTPQRKKQLSICLWHGSPIKSIEWLISLCHWNFNRFDYIFAASDFYRKVLSCEMETNIERVVGIGYPRNDEILKHNVDINKVLGTSFSKIIVWYPTFRQSVNNKMDSLANESIAFIGNEQNATKLNELLKELNYLLIIKPHFSQLESFVKKVKLSNILFISDGFMHEHNFSSYEFVGSSDAFLTDYSSIYYDYLLCDKPIGLVWNDIKEYSKKPGFSKYIDFDYMMSGGFKIYTFNDFLTFFKNLDNDTLKNKRREICSIANFSLKPDNASRAVDFIVSNAKLKKLNLKNETK